MRSWCSRRQTSSDGGIPIFCAAVSMAIMQNCMTSLSDVRGLSSIKLLFCMLTVQSYTFYFNMTSKSLFICLIQSCVTLRKPNKNGNEHPTIVGIFILRPSARLIIYIKVCRCLFGFVCGDYSPCSLAYLMPSSNSFCSSLLIGRVLSSASGLYTASTMRGFGGISFISRAFACLSRRSPM